MTGVSGVVNEARSAYRGALESLMMMLARLDSPMINSLLRCVYGMALKSERPLLGYMPIPKLEFFRERAPRGAPPMG
ncbi:hypothetical protein FOA52_012957 [Chlamydomonas sp. UWO 241]|nr:hypothetical protein FOA52_012957 [Chlamydomonas sp. UWO 241]